MVSVKVIDKDVLNLIVNKYSNKGFDFTVKPKKLGGDLPYDIYQLGRSCAKLMKSNPPLLEKLNEHKSPAIYRTRFGELNGNKKNRK